MELNKKPWPISTVFGIKSRIDTNPDYQRPPVWSISQKRLLIDTILRGYDIPKFYWRKIGKNPDKYEVIDGQQRLRTIWEFMENGFDLGKDAEPINAFDLSGATFSDKNPLPDDLRLTFDTYTLDVICLSDCDEEEVRELFLRLQNGTTLKAQEKRNAMPGKMRDYVKQLASHQFFNHCKFDNSRFTFDLIAAQLTLLELKGEITNIKNSDLNKMYSKHVDFDQNCSKAKKIKRVLDYLLKTFPEKTPELERYSTISLYLIVSTMMDKYVIDGLQNTLREWFISFEAYRRSEKEKSVDDCDPEVVSYHEKTSHSTDAFDSIEWRHKYLIRKFFEYDPSIEIKEKDDNRQFTEEQRLAIYRLNKGICQLKIKCDGIKCDWDNWHADHIIPWSKGGKTTVSNGQVACPECNLSKGNGT